PYQSGFAAVGERLLSAKPFERTWIAREDSEDFARLVDYKDGYRDGARRFDVGETANFINVPMSLAAVRQILAWGVPTLQEDCASLQPALARALGESPFQIAPASDRGAHMFGVRLPAEAASKSQAIVEELKRCNVYVSLRGTSIRVSPHVFSTAG